MAHVTLRLEVDPATRRRTVVVSYTSDADALPNEHEEEHRRLVEKLIEGGLVPAEDRIRVERATGGAVSDEPERAASPAAREQKA